VQSPTEIIQPGSSLCRMNLYEASERGSPVAMHIGCKRFDLRLKHYQIPRILRCCTDELGLRLLSVFDGVRVQPKMNREVSRQRRSWKTPCLHWSIPRHGIQKWDMFVVVVCMTYTSPEPSCAQKCPVNSQVADPICLQASDHQTSIGRYAGTPVHQRAPRERFGCPAIQQQRVHAHVAGSIPRH
jgi:hypothetical protein